MGRQLYGLHCSSSGFRPYLFMKSLAALCVFIGCLSNYGLSAKV